MRKQFANMMLIIFLFALSLTLFTGCSKKTEKAENRTGPLTVGGKISVGSAIEPETWNPLISELAAVQDVGRLVFAGLVLQNDKGEWIPDLAQEVPTQVNGGISADGLTWTFRLKRDLKWQDGQPVTAQDVRFTYDFILQNRQSVPWREGYEKILSVNVVDSATVTIRYAEAYPHAIRLFPFLLPSHRSAELADVRQQNFNRLPVGAGPYVLKEWRQGDALMFVANPLYHRGKPNLDEISYKIVPDRQIVLSQLKIGEVDLVGNIAFDQLEQLLSVTGVNTFLTRGVVWEHIDFNVDNPLFNDVRVRQAISVAVDRTALIEKTLKNAGFPAYTDIHPSSWAYGANLTFPARNLPHARELMAAAGWRAGSDGVLQKEGRRMSFLLTLPAGERFRIQAAEALAGQLAEIGVEMRLQPVERRQFFADVLPNRRFAAASFAWVNSTEPDNYDFWHSRRIPSTANRFTGKNYAGWKSTEADILLDSLRLGGTLDSRRESYRRLQELLLIEAPVIPLYYRADVAAAKRSIDFFKPNPFSGNFWNVWEWGLR